MPNASDEQGAMRFAYGDGSTRNGLHIMKTRMSGTNPLILIIEDELATRRFLRVALASQGYRLAEAVAARDAGAGQKLSEPIITIGELRIDLAMRQVSHGDVAVHLTPTEYRLLIALAQHAGKVLTHPQLLKQVWGQAYANAAHYVRIYMAHLRRKLETDPARPRYLLTEAGVGYRLAAE